MKDLLSKSCQKLVDQEGPIRPQKGPKVDNWQFRNTINVSWVDFSVTLRKTRENMLFFTVRTTTQTTFNVMSSGCKKCSPSVIFRLSDWVSKEKERCKSRSSYNPMRNSRDYPLSHSCFKASLKQTAFFQPRQVSSSTQYSMDALFMQNCGIWAQGRRGNKKNFQYVKTLLVPALRKALLIKKFFSPTPFQLFVLL